MDYKAHVLESLERAEAGKSKLSHEALNLPAFSGYKIKHLLNNLGSMRPLRYLEIGVHKGGTFLATVYKNEPEFAVAVDNWSEFAQDGASKREFLKNKDRYAPGGCMFLERDCFAIKKGEIPSPINMYLYDGNHSEESQYRGVTHFYDMLDEEFVLLVDDWDWGDVKKGTRRAIKDLNLQVVLERELTTGKDSDGDNWWNGFYVGVMKKPSTT